LAERSQAAIIFRDRMPVYSADDVLQRVLVAVCLAVTDNAFWDPKKEKKKKKTS
jgi:hypothetical protein